MINYESLEIESQIYRNSKNVLKILSFLVFGFGLLIILETVVIKERLNPNTRDSYVAEHNYTGYDPDRSVFTANFPPMFADRCLPMRPLHLEECETYYISENSTWRNDDDGMCSQWFLKPGDICEGDGECDTNNNLNNCGDGLDIYLIIPLRERP